MICESGEPLFQFQDNTRIKSVVIANRNRLQLVMDATLRHQISFHIAIVICHVILW